MEILNTTTIKAGWDTFYIIIGSVICLVALFLFIYIFTEWYKDKDSLGSLVFLLYPLAIVGMGIAVMTAGREPVTYNKYDVLFTQPIDMNEFDAKYTIIGKDSNIWHIEDKH